MNTLLFQYALEIERTGSITKAAGNLYMAQPNLSKAVKELETNLGYEIFERGSGGIRPTELGRKFLNYARNIMQQMKELEELSKNKNGAAQSFGVSIPRGSYISNGFIELVANLDLNQEMNISIQETSSMRTIDNVEEERANLGIIRFQTMYEKYFLDYLEQKKLRYDPIWQFEYVIVVNENSPLAEKSEIHPHDLKGYIEITHGDIEVPFIDVKHMEPGPKEENEKEWEEKKIYVFERATQFDLLMSVPQTFMWVSPIPERYLKQFHLVQRKCSVENNQYQDLLIFKQNYKFSELDLLFQEKLYESKLEVISQFE